ncbi:MAG: hypothetical protein HC909_03930 [Blastochloris sp.]|nr:hypothetical protein [Blastochloris sp.]
MIDLNHKSGFIYGAEPPRPPIAEAVSAAIDAALLQRHRSERPRTYVSSSGLGRDCLRQIQFDYLAMPKDEGQNFLPPTLRIFEAGHRAEDIVAGWFRLAGFDLRTARADGRQFGFEALAGRFKGHIDGCFVAGPVAMDYPALWENKALGAASWKDVVKRGVSIARPVYAAQIALYQAYLDLPNPALFTALNRDTMELHAELVRFDAHLAQEMSDRAVTVVRASEAREWLPRGAAAPTAVLCRGGMAAGKWHAPCPWAGRCWEGR